MQKNGYIIVKDAIFVQTLIMRYMILPLIVVCALFTSCGNKNTPDKIIEPVDSSLAKINNPELKEINAQILEDANNAELYYKRGQIYFNTKDVEAAKNDAIRAIKLDSLKPEFYILLADAYFNANETRLSKESLERCLKNNPGSIDANLKLAELFFYVNKYQESINYINAALKINENTAKAYFLKGMCYKESGDTGIAVSSFQTCIEQDNDYFDAYMELGIVLTAKKNPLAIEYLNTALKLQPANLDIVYNIGMYYQKLNNYTKATETYKMVLAKDINYSHAHYNLGAMELYGKKNYKEAIKHFTNAINADANYADAYFARGVCFEEQKDKNNAIADYQMAIQVDPKHSFAIENLNALEGK